MHPIAGRALPAASPLAYDRPGHRKPVVLLHPLGADRQVWDPVLPLLLPHREVVRRRQRTRATPTRSSRDFDLAGIALRCCSWAGCRVNPGG